MPGRNARDGGPGSGGPRFKVREDDQRGKPMGARFQPAYEPNDADRQLVMDYIVVVGRGLMARRIGISPDTLDKYYRKEMDDAIFKAAAINGGRIWKRASEGDKGAQYFFQRTRGGWGNKEDFALAERKETEEQSFDVPPEVLAELSDEEFDLYERLCQRIGGIAPPPAIGPEVDVDRESDAGETPD